MNTKELIENACRHSNYLKELLNAEEAIKKELQKYVVKEFCKADVVDFLKKLPCKSKEDLDSVLRQARKVFYATIIVRDINGLAKLQESFNCNTALAEIFLQYAHNFHAKALVKRYGEPVSEQGKIQQLIIVGMGKLGGRVKSILRHRYHLHLPGVWSDKR
jgi:[glutamine synthetase] adenylyltransferase / [glutamine synthetase]-adenylyl-L-tyrosine phosphorylase